jgi:asparagine synthetase B (glutamine-hydrolysing)
LNGWLVRFDAAGGRFEADGDATTARHSVGGRSTIAAADSDVASLAGGVAEATRLSSPNGVAAAARWDDRAGTLELIRDRTGLQPLFYAAGTDTLIASTDLRALAARPEVDATVSAESASAWLDGRARDPSETLFAAIRRVPPGHIVTLDSNGGVGLRRDWAPPSPRSYARTDASRFGDLLEAATHAHAELGRPAVFLSGGLDSSAVIAASAATSGPLALCVDFVGASETETQGAVTAALRLERTDRAAEAGASLVQRALDLVRESLWPTPAVWGPIFEELATDAVTAGAGVLMDGLGGDELLDAGYAAGRALLQRPWWLAAWLLAERRYAGSAAGSLRTLARRGRPTYAAERARDILDPALGEQREETFDRGCRTGLPRRHPLWSADVVELLQGLPPEALVERGDPKSPARAYLRRRIPEIAGVWPRPKVADTFATQVLDELRRRLAATGTPRLAELGIERGKNGVKTLSFGQIWPMLSLENWLAGVEDWGKGR